MAEEEQQALQEQVSVNPVQVLGGAPVIDDATMEIVLEKLKLLNYQLDFCHTTKPPFKPLSQTFFAGPSSVDNPNTQFYYFSSLCSWLMGQCGNTNFPPPGQFDDPNATATNIVTELRGMNLPVSNLAPNRIRQGSGEAVLTILTVLVDRALTSRGFRFKPVEITMERYDEMAGLEDMGLGADRASDEVEDNISVASEDDDEIVGSGRNTGGAASPHDEVPIAPQVSAEEWYLEVERVAPRLKVRVDDSRDWRARVETANVLLKAVDQMYPDVREKLNHVRMDMEKSHDQIKKREQTLGQQFNEHMEDYRFILQQLTECQQADIQLRQSIEQMRAEKDQLTEYIEEITTQVDDRKRMLEDRSPMERVKDAVNQVREEIKSMTLRIGILQHTVLTGMLRDEKAKAQRRKANPYAEDSVSDFSDSDASDC